VGLLYVRQERIAEIWPNVVAPGWGNDADPDVTGARKFESLGQRDDAALAAVGTTADFHNVLTLAKVEARVMELAAVLKAGLKDAGAKLVTPIEPELSGGVCILEVPSKNRQEMLDRMYKEHGIAGSTSGGFRLCPHVYNTKEHIERAVQGVKQLKNLIA
jgi:selenocysteine lyase/cysteine desulfurase